MRWNQLLAGVCVCAGLLAFEQGGVKAAPPARAGSGAAAGAVADADMFVYFGTHEAGPTRGLSIARFSTKTGALSPAALDVQSDFAGYFILAPDGKHLYTANALSTFRGQEHMGALSAYAIDPKTAKLTLLNDVPSAGEDPSYVRLDKTGKYLATANYWGNHVKGEGGTAAVFALKPDGSIGERTAFVQHKGKSMHPTRQDQAYAHSIVFDPSNRFALICDLGLDRVFVYKFDEKTGTLTPNEPGYVLLDLGTGPRHLVFHPNGKWVYVVQELANQVTKCNWDGAKGVLEKGSVVSTLPEDFKGKSGSAEILVHPSGKFLYATNRGHDSIAQFLINPDTGGLSPMGTVPSGGKTPRNADIDPTGKWLIVTNHDSNNAVVFGISQMNGRLTQVGEPVYVLYPFSPRFLPMAK